MFPEIGGFPPKSSILIGFSIIFTIHFGGFPTIFGGNHPCEGSIPDTLKANVTFSPRKTTMEIFYPKDEAMEKKNPWVPWVPGGGLLLEKSRGNRLPFKGSSLDTWMSRDGSLDQVRINGLFQLLINVVYWDEITHWSVHQEDPITSWEVTKQVFNCHQVSGKFFLLGKVHGKWRFLGGKMFILYWGLGLVSLFHPQKKTVPSKTKVYMLAPGAHV